MKKIFYSALVITALLMSSCTPDNPVTPTTNNVTIGPQPKFQFKGNGTLYNADAVFDPRLGWTEFAYLDNVDEPGFSLTSSQGAYYFRVSFPSPNSIIVGTYNNPSYFSLNTPFFPGTGSIVIGTFNLVISRVSNGTADGTFTGNCWRTGMPNNILNITEGVFSNVPVFE